MTAEGIVAVAVDAAGAGGLRPFSYRVPERLADLAPGEAVLVYSNAAAGFTGVDVVHDRPRRWRVEILSSSETGLGS